MKCLGLLVAAAMLACVSAAAEPTAPQLDVKVTPRTATVGDLVDVDLVVTVPPTMKAFTPRFPDWTDHWGEAEVVHGETPHEVTLADGRVRWLQRVRVTAYHTGRIDLPSRQIMIPLGASGITLQTPSDLSFSISSVLPQGAKDGALKPKPAAPLRALPWGQRFWRSLAIALAALSGAVWWARSRGSTETTNVLSAPSLPPFEELMSGLETLRSITEPLPLHIESSRLLRRYLGRSLAFPAVESTTTEIRRRLTGVHLPPDLVQHVVTLLRRCDEVKFARRRLTAEPEALAREIRGIAESVERHLTPVAPAGRGDEVAA